jgi:putative salt-induced outer membrane protein
LFFSGVGVTLKLVMNKHLVTSLLSILSIIILAGTEVRGEESLRAEVERLTAENAALKAANENLRQAMAALASEEKTVEAAGVPPVVAEVTPVEKLKSPWRADVALGGNFNQGNANSSMFNLRASAVREAERDRLTLIASADWGETEGERSAEKASGSVNYRRTIHDRLYWLVNFDADYDALADLDYRFTLSPGLGYHLIKDEDMELSFEGGPAYVLEQFRDQDANSTVRGRLAQEFVYRLNSRVRLFQNSEFLYNFQDMGDWILTGELGIETSLTDRLALRLTGRDRYANEPAQGRRKNDLSVIGSLVYKFD